MKLITPKNVTYKVMFGGARNSPMTMPTPPVTKNITTRTFTLCGGMYRINHVKLQEYYKLTVIKFGFDKLVTL